MCVNFFNNWKIIKFSHKETSSEDIEKIDQVLLNGISDNISEQVNMVPLIQHI